MVTRTCLNCGEEFQVPYPSSKRVNCKEECRIARLQTLDRQPRADKGIRKSTWVTLTCATCGEDFELSPAKAKRRRHCGDCGPPRQQGLCETPDCPEAAFSRGLCQGHYMQKYRDDPQIRERESAYQKRFRKENPVKTKAKDRHHNLKRYGITPQEWEAMFVAQGGGCALCGQKENSRGHRLAVDHCHKTGVFRGLLCHSCNRAIGLLGDDPNRLRAAADYIEHLDL